MDCPGNPFACDHCIDRYCSSDLPGADIFIPTHLMLKKLIMAINMAVVTIVLIPFYICIIGIAYILHKLTQKKSVSKNTCWESFTITSDFSSPY